MMREKLYEMAEVLGVGIREVPMSPGNWGQFNSNEATVELNMFLSLWEQELNDYVLLHELCHAAQFRTDAPIWLEWCEATYECENYEWPENTSDLELDCEQRVIGWLHLNGYDVEKYIDYINRNLSNYGLEL